MAGAGEEIIQQLLLKAVGLGVSHHGEIQAATVHLNELCDQNRGAFLRAVALELAREEGEAASRHLAGIVLKNKLTAVDANLKATNQGLYVALPEDIRADIKRFAVSALQSPVREAAKAGAQVISVLAAIEIPNGQWPDLISFLESNITGQQSMEVKESSVSALGYICEELLHSDALTPYSNQILTAIVHGMRTEVSDQVRVAATQALYNALPFVQANFEREVDRNFIMTVVCENTNTKHESLRVHAFECLVRIIALYYQWMQPYMATLFQLTVTAIRSAESEPVTMQAIEFWSTVSDEELALQEEAEYAAAEGRAPEAECRRYVFEALNELAPALLETLTKQDEHADDDSWNAAMSAGTCLAIVARVVKNDVVDHVMPFVVANINNTDWHFREAAVLAFGSILEGPDEENLQKLVDQGIGVMLSLLVDPQVHVKDTAAWALGRICELHPTSIKSEQLGSVLSALAKALRDVPQVASSVCWAIHELAVYNEVDNDNIASYPTNDLSPFYKDLVEVLLVTTERPDGDERNLRPNSYEALNAVLQAAAADSIFILEALFPHILQSLEKVMQEGPSNPAAEEVIAKRAGLLYTLTPILKEKIVPHADRLMTNYLTIFSYNPQSIHEEALLACGALCNELGKNFLTYMQAFTPFLLAGIRNFEEVMVCQYALGVLGDLCRGLEKEIAPLAPDAISILLTNVQNPNLDKDLRGPILSSFGDLALAIEENFESYLGQVMQMLAIASKIEVDYEDYDVVDYICTLREGIFEAYTGIIQGLKGQKPDLFLPYVGPAIEFISMLHMEMAEHEVMRNPAVMRVAVGVIGDVATALGAKAHQALASPSVAAFMQVCKQQADVKKDMHLANTVQWAQSQCRKILPGL